MIYLHRHTAVFITWSRHDSHAPNIKHFLTVLVSVTSSCLLLPYWGPYTLFISFVSSVTRRRTEVNRNPNWVLLQVSSSTKNWHGWIYRQFLASENCPRFWSVEQRNHSIRNRVPDLFHVEFRKRPISPIRLWTKFRKHIQTVGRGRPKFSTHARRRDQI